MDIRNRNKESARTRGTVSIQLLVLMVPVLLGFMGFAVDLGHLYLVRGELNQAANAMAIAAASKLNGTSAATDFATNAANLTIDNGNSNANKFNFGSVVIGDTSGFLTSMAASPSYFATASDAMSTDTATGGGSADGTTAQYAQANITADAPLTFWAILSLGQSRKTTIAARAVAGISAPLCVACGVEPFAIAPLDATDTINFGYTIGTRYTLGYMCNGAPQPQALAETSQRIPFLLLDRFDTGSTFDETQQLFRVGAQGLVPSTTQTQACLTINNTELLWASATTNACATNRISTSVQEMLCGVATRMDTNLNTVCSEVSDLDNISTAYQADTDTTDLDDYTVYTGDSRRIITVPIVDALSTSAGMTVLGFRQFLVEPTLGLTANDPTDPNGRISVLYIGSVAPLKQGRFDGFCGATSGPGKVVLFQ